MADLAQDRLVRKEAALGVVREIEPPQEHVGTRLIAPFQEVQSDDVIFSYTRGAVAGLAPARAEDAESELATQDESTGSGRASIGDWALKDHYDASDVTRYREALLIGGLAGAENLRLSGGRMSEEFATKIARHTATRRRKLDNRLEWLIMQALDTGVIAYNDGKIQWSVDFGRPAGQQDMATTSSAGLYWDNPASDPIGDIHDILALARDDGYVIDRVMVSDKAIRNLYKNDAFVSGVTGQNPLYSVRGWGRGAAVEWVQDQTNITFIPYDSVYRTRPLGSNTVTNTRFTREKSAIFLPSEASMAEVESDVGFAATLTAPHPEGNWESGFYEWERETVDPWGRDIGTGIKAFPVFPHLDMTYVMEVLAP